VLSRGGFRIVDLGVVVVTVDLVGGVVVPFGVLECTRLDMDFDDASPGRGVEPAGTASLGVGDDLEGAL